MPRFTTTVTSAAALANGSAIAALVPAAAANAKITGIKIGVVNAGGAITDFDASVGLNRDTARGVQTATAVLAKADPNSGASVITAVDTAWSTQPTLAAADDRSFQLNSRGTYLENFQEYDIVSNVGTANGLVLVNRSGAALPAGHSFVVTINWFE